MNAEAAQPCITTGRKIKCRQIVLTAESFRWFLISAAEGWR
jgi:hypothetical protein